MDDKVKEKILIIDDEQGIRDLFCFLLRPKGYDVFTAADGEEGVAMVKKENFGIIFLDVHMPKLRGPEVLKIIKQINPKQLVIIFSSSSDPNYVFEENAESYGAYRCLYKPVEISQILGIISEALSREREKSGGN
ncbi:MAG: response regulator [bacterium]|nr:response regulator [bacterium]